MPLLFVSENFYMVGFSLKNLKAIAVQVLEPPIFQFSRRGIVVSTTPGANANAVKEAVIKPIPLSARL